LEVVMNRQVCASALVLSLGLAGCNACSPKPSGDPSASGDRSKGKTKAKAKATPEVAPKDTTTVVVFPDKDPAKVLVWIESRSGSLTTTAADSYWNGDGVTLGTKGTYQRYLSNGGRYQTLTPPAEAKSLAAMLSSETSPPPGYSIEAITSGGGRQRLTVKPPIGAARRLGMFDSIPAPIVWLEATAPASTGAATAAIPAASFAAREGGGYNNTLPEGATAVAGTPLTGEALAPYKADLEKIRGAGVTIHLAEQVNLDGDADLEAILCAPSGLARTCHVADKVGEEMRYYNLDLVYAGGDPRPLYFTTDAGPYLMFSPPLSPGGAPEPLWVVRFDGDHYTTDTLK
jgi:hypothetical protein